MTPDDPTTPLPVETAGEPEFLDESPEVDAPPRFEFRAFWTPKRGNSEDEWEDGYLARPGEGLLALADGAGDGVFTRQWVRQLLDGYCRQPFPLDDSAAVASWIAEERRGWLEAIDYPSLRWSLQMKVDRSCAAATFLGFQIEPTDSEKGVGWSAWAVGDVCLFQVREGGLMSWFPVGNSSEFGMTPELYQSKAIRPLPSAATLQGELLPEDLLFFATDALACRLLSATEQGEPPDWQGLWEGDQDSWVSQIEQDRDLGLIVNDDCTMVILRLPRESQTPPEGPTTDGQEPTPEPVDLEEEDWPWEPADPDSETDGEPFS